MKLITSILTQKSTLLAIIIICILNWLASSVAWKIDFTEDQRFSIADNTVAILEKVEQPIFAEILFAGNFDAGPARLQEATEDMLKSFQQINNKLRYNFNDPFEGDGETIAKNQEELARAGMTVTSFSLPEGEEVRQRAAYPYVVFFQGDYRVPVEIIEPQSFGDNGELTINESIALLEYKFASAIQRINRGQRPLIYFTEGHEELVPLETIEYEKSARPFFQTGRLHLDSTDIIDPNINVLVVAKPLKPFSESDLFKIDQYIMQGGKVVWMLDPVGVQLDSLRGKESFVPTEIELNLDALFFKYGLKLNQTLVVDTECTRIPLNVATQGGQPKLELFPYYYHLVPDPNPEHVTGSKLDRVNLLYAGSIDTLKTRNQLRREVLLRSSNNSFEQSYPMNLDFEIQKLHTEFEKFDDGNKILGLLIEGSFPSLYANRPGPGGERSNYAESVNTSMVVIADGDLIKNKFDAGQDRRPSPIPLGLNRYENYQFDNKAFFDNIIAYLLGEGQLLEARKRNVQLRLLNKPKISSEKSKWQMINIGLPLLLLALFGIFNGYIRRRKYAN